VNLFLYICHCFYHVRSDPCSPKHARTRAHPYWGIGGASAYFFCSFDACTWSAKHLRKCNAQVTLTRGVTDTTQTWHKTLIKLRATEYQLMIDLADVLAVFA
jgi:hypothetical protein